MTHFLPGSTTRCVLWFTTLMCAHVALEASPSSNSLKRLSLEELMNVEVTSVSRHTEELFGAAAAIAVVSSDDLRRSGATTIPQGLRGLSGLHVAQRNANFWTVNARGFSGSNSEKLLVLSDTRSLYTPLVSGVFWDVQDYLLADIERIEVIRGPGAALWGSNAVNGVINITSKHARDTLGSYVETGAGTEEEVFVAARHGAELGEDLQLRVFGKYSQRDSSYQAQSVQSDDWRNSLAGFRSDWQMNTADSLTVQANAYRGEVGQFAPTVIVAGRAGPPGALRSQLRGGNVLARWRHAPAERSSLQLRFYYDRARREDPSFIDDLQAYDLDLQHRMLLGDFAGAEAHEVTWGLNYRYTDHENLPGLLFRLDPASSSDTVLSAFVQDQMSVGEHVRITLGSKFEDNDFSGFELQPSLRAAWTVAPRWMLWSAVSRAVRVPTRLERDTAIDVGNPAANPVVRLLGNKNFDSEELLAYELGTRWQPSAELFVDVAAFHNRYDGLVSLELGQTFTDLSGRSITPIVNRNLTDGESTGIETLATWVASADWQLTAHYSYLELELEAGGADLNRGVSLEGATPRHQFGVRSSYDIGALSLDMQLRSLSDIERSPELAAGERIAGYTELDLRIGWRWSTALELSLVGQNLLHDRHPEFGSPQTRGEVERSVYGKFVWTF